MGTWFKGHMVERVEENFVNELLFGAEKSFSHLHVLECDGFIAIWSSGLGVCPHPLPSLKWPFQNMAPLHWSLSRVGLYVPQAPASGHFRVLVV